jgi:membrane-associated PAP2 superfamily phosphatase
MGAYKMAIGDHFLSHTVVSMLLAWLIINLIVIADDRLQTGILKGLQPAVNS